LDPGGNQLDLQSRFLALNDLHALSVANAITQYKRKAHVHIAAVEAAVSSSELKEGREEAILYCCTSGPRGEQVRGSKST